MMLLEMKKYFHQDFLQKRLNFKETNLFPVMFWNFLVVLSTAVLVQEGSRVDRLALHLLSSQKQPDIKTVVYTTLKRPDLVYTAEILD